MNDKIEAQGKTVKDAVAEALLRLGARRDEVIVKIIEEPKSGFLGLLGGRPARVLVEKKRGDRPRGGNRPRPNSASHSLTEVPGGDNRREAPGSRGGSRRGRRPAARGENRDASGPGRPARSPNNEEGPRSENPRNNAPRRDQPRRDNSRRETARGEGARRDKPRNDRPRNDTAREDGRGRNRRPRVATQTETTPSDKNPPAQAVTNRDQRDQGERNDRNRRNRRGPRNQPAPEKSRPAATLTPTEQEAPHMDSKPVARTEPTSAMLVREGLKGSAYAKALRGVGAADLKENLENLAGGMLIRAGFPCRCQVMDGEYFQVRIVTDDASAGMLIGRHGSTVDSVEHLVERMISTASGDRVKMNLDINNYRRRRQDTLADRVFDAIGRVRETGRAYHLEPMNARERRLVHLQVADVAGLSTTTVVDDGAKHVVISREESAPQGVDEAREANATSETSEAAVAVTEESSANSPQTEA